LSTCILQVLFFVKIRAWGLRKQNESGIIKMKQLQTYNENTKKSNGFFRIYDLETRYRVSDACDSTQNHNQFKEE